MNKGPISNFIEKHYKHFNAAALVDAAKGYETHLTEGGKMMVTLAGAMSTAELGKSLAEMIRAGKVDIISITKEFRITVICRPRMNGICLKITTTVLQTRAYRKKRHSEDCKNTFIRFGKMRIRAENVFFPMNTCTKYC